MTTELKTEFLQTIFQFKNLINGSLGSPKDWQITLTEFLVLQKISDGKNLATIREDLRITKAAISQTLSALEKKNFLTRETNPQNRRQLIVKLTVLGNDVLAQTSKTFNQGFDIFVGEMNEQNLQQMLDQMQRMIEVLGN